jgi:thiol-disulfide isomerase/thioredoxin
MKRNIFLPLFLIVLVTGCGSERSGGSASESGSSSPAQLSFALEGESELEEKLGNLGFQIPTGRLEAIDFSLNDLSGKEKTLSSYSGNVVFLNFWATWCGPCRAEIPSMEQLYGELREEGFVILAVNSQEHSEQVSTFVEETEMSFPVLLDSTGKVGATYGVRAIPTTYIIDAVGVVRGRMVGSRSWYSPQIVSLVKELLP